MMTPGMIYGPPAEAGSPMGVPMGMPAGPLAGIAPGGAISPRFGLPAGPDVAPGPNPIQVPVANDEAAWEQIVDVVSEYFPIASEQQARRSGAVWTEGRIETAYQRRGDDLRAVSQGFGRFVQSLGEHVPDDSPDRDGPRDSGWRRVIRSKSSCEKELEDLPRPENATAGVAVFRNDRDRCPRVASTEVSRMQSSPRWIQLGRDPALEGRMLADIQARFTAPPDSSWPTFW